jgi:hypothetical protein
MASGNGINAISVKLNFALSLPLDFGITARGHSLPFSLPTSSGICNI